MISNVPKNFLEPWHGTPGGYSNHKCRCDDCRLAWNKYCADRKRARRAAFTADETTEHGLMRTYQRGCTCPECKTAQSRYSRQIKSGNKPRTGVCEICRTEGTVIWDHEHTSGDHRGWLCLNCNHGLGGFNDDPSLITRAINYLERDR